MGSHWCQGGLDALHDNAASWLSATMRTSIVQGASISTPDNLPRTLQEFLNDGNTLTGSEQLLPSTSYGWDGSNGYDFTFDGQVNFGPVTNGTPIAGVVYYDGTSGDPPAATVWGCQESPDTALGGDVLWGAAGSNIALSIDCLNIANRYSFRGTLQAIDSISAYWGDATQRIGYALVANQVAPQFGWQTISNAESAGVVWCTGGEPGDGVNNPYTPVADRIGPAIDQVGTAGYYEFGIVADPPRTVIEWDIANLNDTEFIAAVVHYTYKDSAGYDPATAQIIGWDYIGNPGYDITPGKNVRYMTSPAVVLNRIQIL